MYRLKVILYISLFVSIISSSCRSRRNTLFNTEKAQHVGNLPVYVLEQGADSLINKEQIIMPGDLLIIQNLQNDALIAQGAGGGNASGQNIQNMISGGLRYRVENDSTVIIPVLGSVKLGGLTRIKAQEKLNKLYQSQLLKDPIITLSIVNLQVTMLGEFGKQGNYVLNKDQVSLIQMLGEAGGLNARANKKKIKIVRGNLQDPTVIMVDLTDINSLADQRLYLRNNDIVYAETKGAFQTLDAISPATSFLSVAVSALNLYLILKTLNK